MNLINLDFAAAQLRKNSTIATKESNRLQFDNAGWRSIQLLWNHFDSISIRFVAVSNQLSILFLLSFLVSDPVLLGFNGQK